MRLVQKFACIFAATATAFAVSSPVQAEDEVNIAFFLEWGTPNMIAKVKKTYDDAMGAKINWINFDSGSQMTEGMLAGDIDIAYSQGLAPFITGVNANAPIKTVGIAVSYTANPCVVKSGSGISMENASELEGKTVAIPLATMADYSFRMQMRALNVDLSTLNIVDQVPPDAVVSLANGSVDFTCLYGGDSIRKALEAGDKLMSDEDMEKAGIISFDVVSVTEAFAKANPELVRTFMDVTNKANIAYTADKSDLEVIARETGMDTATTKNQMQNFAFPTNAEQLNDYFSENGLAAQAIAVVGGAFATDENPALDDYSQVIDTSFLK